MQQSSMHAWTVRQDRANGLCILQVTMCRPACAAFGGDQQASARPAQQRAAQQQRRPDHRCGPNPQVGHLLYPPCSSTAAATGSGNAEHATPFAICHFAGRVWQPMHMPAHPCRPLCNCSHIQSVQNAKRQKLAHRHHAMPIHAVLCTWRLHASARGSSPELNDLRCGWAVQQSVWRW